VSQSQLSIELDIELNMALISETLGLLDEFFSNPPRKNSQPWFDEPATVNHV
jgi:hypothetical protein